MEGKAIQHDINNDVETEVIIVMVMMMVGAVSHGPSCRSFHGDLRDDDSSACEGCA